MGNEFRGQPAHSAEHFGDARDHWWNLDFLQLMAKRWRLDAVRDLLDVGCGVGHWGMQLSSVMPDHVRVTGIDREPVWVEKANTRARAAEDARDRVDRRLWNWSEPQARRFFLAGGGSEDTFAVHFARAIDAGERIVGGLNDGTYHGIAGGEFYVVAGRKPEGRA